MSKIVSKTVSKIAKRIVGVYWRVADSCCRKLICTGLVLMAALGWWGALYPQHSLNQDTYRIVSEDGTVQRGDDVVEWENGDTVYMEILNAESGKIRFRSRLWDCASELIEHLKGK